AHEMETRYHLDLVPALLVLVAVFAFHQHSKRQQSKADALLAANDAAEARARSEELGRLMAMGQAAGNALDQSALQQVLWRRLPTFCGDREAWLLTRYRNRWEAALQEAQASSRRTVEQLEQAAERALSRSGDAESE